MIQTGRHGLYQWLVAPTFPTSLVKLTVRFHPSLRLCITAVEGGYFSPSSQALAAGWSNRGKVTVSPPLAEGLDIPLDEYEEWYLLAEPPPSEWAPEVFVWNACFTLVPVEELYNTYDPTWDKHGLDYLIPIQERFWVQIKRVEPVTYIAMGDQFVVVTRRSEFLERLKADA